MRSPRVVIVGSTCSSAAVFSHLSSYISKSRILFDVLFLASKNFYFFNNLLSQYLCTSCTVSDLCQEFRDICFLRPGLSILTSCVLEIDFKSQVVKTPSQNITYDYLVLAGENDLCDDVNLFENVNCFHLKNIIDVVRLQNHIFKTLEIAASEQNDVVKKSLLSFSVIGAETKGIELACGIYDLVNNLLKKRFPEISPLFLNVNLIEKKSTLNISKDAFYNSYILYALNKKGIKVHFKSEVINIKENKIILTDEKKIVSDTIICSGQNKTSSLVQALPLEKDENSNIMVNLYLNPKGYENVFVIGESSRCFDVNEKHIQGVKYLFDEAKICAHNVFAKINNNSLKPLKTSNDIDFVFLGQKSALGEIKRFCFSGYFAWLFYRLYTIGYFLGLRKRIKALVSFIIAVLGLNDFVSLDITSLSTEAKTKKQLTTVR